jgi:hypothetical protein
MRQVILGLALTCAAVLLPASASAQVGIAGSVKDSSGAVLPGVTVEASSPALIEKSRTVVSDGAGQYRIVDLSPGPYQVTFTLQGFKTTRRTDIVLEGTLIAQVNAEMAVGSLEESITVTGASPVVDVVSNRTSFVASRDILDTLPVSSRSLPARVNLIPGASVTFAVLGQYNMSIHGSAPSDMTIAVDGMRLNNLCGAGQYSGFYLNDASAQEITFLTGSGTSEVGSGGLRINVVPKDGGNRFSGSLFGYGAWDSLQADNRSDAVRPFVLVPPGIDYDFQVNPSFGGPIVRDKLWFYFAYRRSNYVRYATGAVFADGTPIPIADMGNFSAIPRITWQATSRDKFRLYVDRQSNGESYNNASSTRTPEATWDAEGGGWTPQIKWTQTTTNRILLEAGYIRYDQPYYITYNSKVGKFDLPRNEVTTGRWSGANEYPWTSWTLNNGLAGSMSYVTGSHSVKTGMTLGWGSNASAFSPNGQIYSLYFFNGAPVAVVVRNTPFTATQQMKADLGIYAQDAWTMGRLTLNFGGRYDYFNSQVPAHYAEPGPWVPFVRDFPAVANAPKWNDWSVRIAGAYDLFGDGKTALKVGANRYLESMANGFAANFNPMTPRFETRTWTDRDFNKSILDANGNIQYSEVGAGSANFGAYSSTRRPDEDLRRGYNWEHSVSVQHELMQRVSVTVGYYRRQYRNLRVTDNLNLGTGDWNEFKITAPSDPRFPAGSGAVITMHSVNANKLFSAVDELVTFSTTNRTVYNGFEASVNARFNKGFLFGGVTTQRTASTSCDVRDNPNSFLFCDNVAPFKSLLKGSISYELPYGLQVSGAYYGTPGSSVSANYTVNAALAGRAISGGIANEPTISVNLIEPNTLFLDYRNQVDGRVARNFRIGRYRIQGFADIFNIFNAGTVIAVNTTYGSNPATNAWLNPTAIATGRTLRVGAQMEF